jgi:hypothetical protein
MDLKQRKGENMNLNFLFNVKKKSSQKLQESTEEAIVRIGKNQFKRLVAKGLRVPVVML